MKTNSIVILCGGLGTRVSDLTKDKPKILIEINKKPFLYYLLKILKRNKVRNIYFLTHYRSHMIRNYVKQLGWFNFYICDDGINKLGTGGSLNKNLSKLPKSFYLTYGDSYLDFDYSLLEKKFKKTYKNIITIYKNKSPKHKNNILLINKKIIRYQKNSNFNYIDYGLFLLKKNDLENAKFKKKIFDFGEFISFLIRNKKISYILSKKRFQECGSYDGIRKIEKILKKN